MEAVNPPDPVDGAKANEFPPALVGPDTLNIWRAIESQGLAPYIAELEVKGFAVVPPEVACTTDLRPRLLHKILDVAERRWGMRPVVESDDRANSHGPLGSLLPYLLFEDEVFEEYLMHPAVLAFVDYMLGKNSCLSSMQSQLKGTADDELQLHADNVVFSSPFPAHYQFCNVSINLTEYTMDDGPICFVPGSHKLYRHPASGEAMDQRVPVEAEPGSLIVFTGNTWHGALTRKNPGLRVSMLSQFVRPQVRAFELYREKVTDVTLARHGSRFRALMGRHTNYGWAEEGPQNAGYAYQMGAHAYD